MKYTEKKITEKRQNDIFVIRYFYRQSAIENAKHSENFSFYQTL
jgi:hypothetical protein